MNSLRHPFTHTALVALAALCLAGCEDTGTFSSYAYHADCDVDYYANYWPVTERILNAFEDRLVYSLDPFGYDAMFEDPLNQGYACQADYVGVARLDGEIWEIDCPGPPLHPDAPRTFLTCRVLTY